MSLRRDHLFPATSIGRSQSPRISRSPSYESLTTHPLLSSGSTTSITSEVPSGHAGAALTVNTNPSGPKYVPYTPRQRAAPTATTGIVHPASPQQHQGDATSKLQMMNLQAATQSIGLDTASVGWAMLEKLVLENEQGEDWAEIWNAMTSGRATLLLPLERITSQDRLTAEFIKDHIVICDASPHNGTAQAITLSGVRGILVNDNLTFRSTISTTSKQFHDLQNPSTRSHAFSSLPPLPPLPSPSTTYPNYVLPTHTSTLPLPPRLPPIYKPPLPPRAGSRIVSGSVSSSTSTPRLPNPFASLFGHKTPQPLIIPQPSPPASIHTNDSHTDTVTEISAYTIGRKIIRQDVAKNLNKAIRAEVKSFLIPSSPSVPVPGWVVDRVHEFTNIWYPFVKLSPLRSPTEKQDHHSQRSGSKTDAWSQKSAQSKDFVVNEFEEAPEEASQRTQEFYTWLEQDYSKLEGASFLNWKEKEDSGLPQYSNGGGIYHEKQQEEDRLELRIREVMDVVERTICVVFYDRLFLPTTSDDALHDEALSSRVAALNMLDLTLDHLDVDAGEAEPQLDSVIKACGLTLSQLNSRRSPADKAIVLVEAHKAVVEGLSKLPPVRIRTEEESANRPLRNTTHLEERQQNSSSGDSTQPPPLDHSSSSASSVSVDSPPSSAEKPPLPLAQSPPPLPPPVLTKPTPVSGDVLLPLIIFSVVKTNPLHLVSNLLYIQRFRLQSIDGEESYCLVNLLAVAEFLENVDLAALGLVDGNKVISTADLTPIPLRSPATSERSLEPLEDSPGSLRGLVEQRVNAITGPANKVLNGVVDSSFGIIRSLLPNSDHHHHPGGVGGGGDGQGGGGNLPWNSSKPGFGLLKRESGFSIASIAASLPGRSRLSSTGGGNEESGQQLVTVSRPGSVRSSIRVRVDEDSEGSEESGSGTSESGSEEEGDEADQVDHGEREREKEGDRVGDARSIKSFGSMMSERRNGPRKSLSDRLAHVSGLVGRKGSLGTQVVSANTPGSSRPASPVPPQLAPPIHRFMECTPDDLRLAEVGELLRDYRRLAESLQALGAFE